MDKHALDQPHILQDNTHMHMHNQGTGRCPAAIGIPGATECAPRTRKPPPNKQCSTDRAWVWAMHRHAQGTRCLWWSYSQ